MILIHLKSRPNYIKVRLAGFIRCKIGSLQLLGAFAKLRKAIISVVMSVGPSASPHRTTRLPLDGF